MKNEEDEAFDELAKRQGSWGGGFKAKQAMAADKQHWNEDEWRRNNWRCGHGWLRGEQCESCNAAQPAQEPVKLWLWKNFVDGKPEYWAFDNPFPIFMDSHNPQTLGEPCGYAWFKPSRAGRTDVSEEQVLLGIQKALAQPAQEPVAWQTMEAKYPSLEKLDIRMGDGSILCDVWPQSDGDLWWEGSGTGEKFIDPKYANVTHWRIHAKHTAPPQREWVGLTNDEVNNLAAGCHLGKSVQGAIYEAAAKLKEKNA